MDEEVVAKFERVRKLWDQWQEALGAVDKLDEMRWQELEKPKGPWYPSVSADWKAPEVEVREIDGTRIEAEEVDWEEDGEA